MLVGWLLRINLDEGIECVDDREKSGTYRYSSQEFVTLVPALLRPSICSG